MMNKLQKRIAAAVCGLTLFTQMFASPIPTYAENEEKTTVTPGLIVAEGGTLTLAGKPFYAFGENNYGTYARWTEDIYKDWFHDSLPVFQEYNIPFIRCAFSGFSPDYYAAFDEDPEMYLEMLDEVVRCAEENRIGLIASLMWLEISVPTHVGEKRSAFGDPNSKTTQYARQYVTTIVERYKDSPAIWGWEIGNEYNLGADLCDETLQNWAPTNYTTGDVNTYDYYTSTELVTFYEEVANAIRAVDPDRMISNGNGEMRPFAYASYKQSTNHIDKDTHTWSVDWTTNTLPQFNEMCAFFTPDPMDTLSFHFQHATLGSDNPQYSLTHQPIRDAGEMSLTEYIRLYVEACKTMQKACYFGEFGDMLDMNDAPDRAEKFQYVIDCIREAGVQLASAWHYQDMTTEGLHGENMEMIGKANLQYREEGKQDLSAYWDHVEYRFLHTSADAEAETETGEASQTGEATDTESTAPDSGAETAETGTDAEAGGMWKLALPVGGAVVVIAAVLLWFLLRRKQNRKQ